jgi:hypothetical protein
MNIDQMINEIGLLFCRGISMASMQLSENAGCLSVSSYWSLGVAVFALLGGALIAVLMWCERKN